MKPQEYLFQWISKPGKQDKQHTKIGGRVTVALEFEKMCLLKAEIHSSEIRGLCLMKCYSEMLHNLQYFWNMKCESPCFFSFCATLFLSPNECPGLCQHRPGHSLGGK